VTFSALARAEDDDARTVDADRFDGDGHWLEPPAEWRDPEQRLPARGCDAHSRISGWRWIEAPTSPRTGRFARGIRRTHAHARLFLISLPHSRSLNHR
jgi:hypothetical protein